MNKTFCFTLLLPVIGLADAGVLDYVEPILGAPVVATSAEYVAEALETQGWSSIEVNEERVSAERVLDGRDERLEFTFTPPGSTSTEIHQDILSVEYSYVPWLEVEGGVERVKEEFNRLVEAFDYLIGPGVTETSDTGTMHTWPDRDTSRIELLLQPMWETRLTASVYLVPLQESDSGD